MDPALVPALLAFTFVAAVTPGPNNVMLLASGANFGLARSLPHMAGIAIGHPVLVLVLGLGLAGLLEAVPLLRPALTALGVAYLLWLAWKVATAAPARGEAPGRPLTFWQAAAFQWVNPKAWLIGIGAVALYARPGSAWGAAAVAAAFLLTSLPSVLIWTALGGRIGRHLASPARLRAFNWTMAALLVLSVLPVLAP